MTRFYVKLPDRAQRGLDAFRRFVDNDRLMIRIAFVGLGLLSIGGWVVNAKTNQAQVRAASFDARAAHADARAARAVAVAASAEARAARVVASRKAEVESAYQSCLASIKPLAAFRQHVRGTIDFTATLVQNSAASIRAAPPDDPLAATRKANYLRLRAAQRSIAAFGTFPVPTRAQCVARRDHASQ